MANNTKNKRSRYDANRQCYRENNDEYVFLQQDSKGRYSKIKLVAGENGVTQELLDYLQATDNLDVQQPEGDRRLVAKLVASGEFYARSAEDEYFADEEEEDALTRAFNEFVRPHFTEEQLKLMYERYGMFKTLQQIADESPSKEDGTHVTHQSVSNRLTRMNDKVKKYIPQ